MAAKKSTINAFESELAIALRSAAITAAANVIQSNPDMTLEDFYAVIKPQGMTETVTLAQLMAAVSGEEIVVTAAAPPPRSTPRATAAPTGPKKVRKPAKLPVINCMTAAGQEAYHRSILEYLASVDDWVRSPDITAYCGGDKSQIGTAMRKHLIPSGLVKNKGKTYGLHFAITSKGKRKAASGSAVTASRAAPTDLGRTKTKKKRTSVNGIGDSSRTIEARDAYRAGILKFLHGSKWRAGPEISAACGGAPARRKLALKHLIEEGVVESNGKATGAVRFRLARA